MIQTVVKRDGRIVGFNEEKIKAAIRKAFEYSQKGIGLSFVEIVATCNSGWKMSPTAANKWMVENMFPKYPLGDIKDVLKQE